MPLSSLSWRLSKYFTILCRDSDGVARFLSIVDVAAYYRFRAADNAHCLCIKYQINSHYYRAARARLFVMLSNDTFSFNARSYADKLCRFIALASFDYWLGPLAHNELPFDKYFPWWKAIKGKIFGVMLSRRSRRFGDIEKSYRRIAFGAEDAAVMVRLSPASRATSIYFRQHVIGVFTSYPYCWKPSVSSRKWIHQPSRSLLARKYQIAMIFEPASNRKAIIISPSPF